MAPGTRRRCVQPLTVTIGKTRHPKTGARRASRKSTTTADISRAKSEAMGESDTHILDAVSARPWAIDVLDHSLLSWRDGTLGRRCGQGRGGCLIFARVAGGTGPDLAKLGRWEEAVADLKKTLPETGRPALVHDALAEAYDHLGNPEQAAAHRRQAAELRKPPVENEPIAKRE